jgi:4-amino-4-deoxy-L-arabinose transferase-like glycosyltransferase
VVLPRSGLSAWSARLGLAAVVALFCLPLFIGLRGWDLRNDEAIYSYAVDRMIETGDWLTPRTSNETPFLEKPPLKFWLVAGAMRVGLLPFDDFGMRAFDVLFCGVALVYVYLIGRRLAGPLAGLVAAFLLFSFDPLIFEHGVRGNNMDAAVFLAYCGGMYHFLRWTDEDAAARRRRHAFAWAAYFVLGFMTKFVAIAFLPIVGIAALAVKPGGLALFKSRWRDWIAPVVLAAVVIVPWFVYQSIHSGKVFWDTLVLEHVYTRFMGTLIPQHRRPWYHYFTQTWFEMNLAGQLPAILAGFCVLAWRAWLKKDWLARSLFLWFLVPFALISLGTSKLFYYAYPFMPPLALGAGAAAALFVQLAADAARALAIRLGLRQLRPEEEHARRLSRWGPALAIAGGLAFAAAVWTFARGPLTFEIAGLRLFRNSSVVRPVLAGAVLWYFAGFGSAVFRIAAVTLLAFVLPIAHYNREIDRFSSIDHPLRTARDCALAVQASGVTAGKGVYDRSGDLHQAYFYYLRRTGPWIEPGQARPDELVRRLDSPGEQSLVIVSAEDYRALGEHGLPPGIEIGDVVVILFPGPYATCAAEVARDGARLLKAK